VTVSGYLGLSVGTSWLFSGYLVAVFPVVKQRGFMLNTYPNLIPRLAIRGAISLLPPYAFMARAQ
jgi:hypothetical protein